MMRAYASNPPSLWWNTIQTGGDPLLHERWIKTRPTHDLSAQHLDPILCDIITTDVER